MFGGEEGDVRRGKKVESEEKWERLGANGEGWGSREVVILIFGYSIREHSMGRYNVGENRTGRKTLFC